MAQQVIENSESGLDCRNAINGNFSELYSDINPPIFLIEQTASTSQSFLPNTWVNSIFLRPIAGTPMIAIGLTPGGQEILGFTSITYAVQIMVQLYFSVTTTIYFTWDIDGELNIRIDLINNYD